MSILQDKNGTTPGSLTVKGMGFNHCLLIVIASEVLRSCTHLIAISLAHCLQDNHLGASHTLERIASVVCLNNRASTTEKRHEHLR